MTDPYDKLPSDQPVLTPSGAIAQEVCFLNYPGEHDGPRSTVFFGGDLQGDVAIDADKLLRETGLINARVLGTVWLSMGEEEPPIELKVLDLSATWDPKPEVALFQRRIYDSQLSDMVVHSTPVSSSLVLYHKWRYSPDEAHTYDILDVPGGSVRVGAYRADEPYGYSYVPRHAFGGDQALLELRMINNSALEIAAVGPNHVFIERAVRTFDDDITLM